MMIPGIMAQRRVVSGGGTLWTPLNMATVPQIYLDAQDSVVTDVGGFASAISNLGAMGANGDFSQGASGSRPSILAAELNGKRVLRFDGADDLATCATPTALAVFRQAGAAWVFSIYKKRTLDGSPTARYLFFSPRNDSGGRFGVLCADFVAGAANKPYMFAIRLDTEAAGTLKSPNVVQGSYAMFAASTDFYTRSAFIRENGTEVASTTAITASAGLTSDTQSTTSALSIGAFPTGSFPADIDLAAFLIGNVQPAADEFYRLEGWAAHKYGLTANLPSDHPYKTAAPTV